MKKFVVVILAIVLTMALAVPAFASFTDVPENHWAKAYIDYAEANHLINGMGDGTFAPDAVLTEAQCAQILYNMSGKAATTETRPGQPWYYNAVSYIENRTGLYVTPEATASREWLCVLFYAYEKDNARAKAPVDTLTFTDCGGLSPNSLMAVKWCVANNIINGFEDNTFRPNDGLTRAQGAKVFSVLYQNLESKTFREMVDDAAETMKLYAQSLGLAAETTEWTSSPNEYWRCVKVQSVAESGHYQFLVGGTDTVLWYTTDRNGDFALSTEEGIRAWLKDYANGISIKDKTLAAVRAMKTQAEGLGLSAELKDWRNDTPEYFWQGLVVTGTEAAIFVAGGKNQVTWYKKAENGNLDKITEAEIRTWMQTQAEALSRVPPEQKMQRSIDTFVATAKKAGMYVEYSVRSGKEWADVTLYGPYNTYNYIVGTANNWFDVDLKSMTEEEALGQIGKVAGTELERLQRNIELTESLFDEAGLIPVTNANSQSRTARIGAYDYPSWNLLISGTEGGDLATLRNEIAKVNRTYNYNQKVKLAAKYFIEEAKRLGYTLETEGESADTAREYWYGFTVKNALREYSLSFGGNRNDGYVGFFRFVGDGTMQFTRAQLITELETYSR